MIHDFSTVHVDGRIRLWIRPRLQEKIPDIIQTSRDTQVLSPGTAKLYGCVAFLDQAAFGKVARAGLNAIKDRQRLDTKNHLTPELHKAFRVIESIIRLNPRRVATMKPSLAKRIMGASDVAQESSIGRGGFLLSDRYFNRIGSEVAITHAVMSLWKPQVTLIAQFELLMLLQALLTFLESFRHCTGVWFIDSIASLMALIKGRSDNADLDRMAFMIHLLLYHLDCFLWFEWVQSQSNWSDGISRVGGRSIIRSGVSIRLPDQHCASLPMDFAVVSAQHSLCLFLMLGRVPWVQV